MPRWFGDLTGAEVLEKALTVRRQRNDALKFYTKTRREKKPGQKSKTLANNEVTMRQCITKGWLMGILKGLIH